MKNKFAREFISRVGKIGKRWGLGEPAGKIWGALAYSKKPLTQKEIATSCNYSLGLVSRNLQILRKLGIAKPSQRRGKEKLYSTVASFSDSFSKLVNKFKSDELGRLFHMLESGSRKSAKQKLSTALVSLTRV